MTPIAVTGITQPCSSRQPAGLAVQHPHAQQEHGDRHGQAERRADVAQRGMAAVDDVLDGDGEPGADRGRRSRTRRSGRSPR